MTESKKISTIKTGRKLVAILDKLLENEDWNASLFLKTTKKRFAALRDETYTIVEELEKEEGVGERSKTAQISLEAGYIKIYIFLYQTEGNNLLLWQKLIKSIAQHSLTRPIYKNEDDIRELIRSKPDPQKLGYVVIAINEDDIVKMDNPPVDRFEHELLTLKEGAVKMENIIEFVHANKKHYIYQNHTLSPISDE